MRSPVPTLLAVLSPLVVLAAAAGWLLREDERPLTPEAAANDAALAAAGPAGVASGAGIVIVGNSKSNTDIHTGTLQKALAYGRPVVNVKVAGSSAPAWYAVLEQRVFAAGYRPELVIVYGQLAAMLRVEASALAERVRVENQLTTTSPVLEAKVFGTGGFGGARRRATSAHDALLAGIRDLSVGLLLAPSAPAGGDGATPGDGGLLAAGKATAEPALAKLFGSEARFLSGGPARVVPVAEAASSWAMTASDGPPSASLLPDLVALARAHDAKIVFVRAPLPPSSQFRDSLPLPTEAAALELLNELGVSYVDLHGIPLPPGAFLDDYHLSPTGRATFTAALATALLEADVLNGGVARARPALVPASVTRVGALPPTPALSYAPAPDRPCLLRAKAPDLAFLSDDTLVGAGIGYASPLVLADAAGPLQPRPPGKTFGDTCGAAWRHRPFGVEVAPRAVASADGLALTVSPELSVPDEDGAPVWWVYPDTATEWRYDTPWKDGPLRVSVTARAVGAGATATLRVGDVEAPLEPEGRLLRATIELPPPSGGVGALPAPWTVSVSAGPDTWLILDELLLGAQRVIGEPAATVNPLARRATAKAEPPAIVTGAVASDGTLTTIAVPGYAHLADDALRARLDYTCSPLQVGAVAAGADGWLIDAGHKLRKLLLGGKPGYLHEGDTLLLAPPDGAAMPAGPYAVRLDPLRRCAKGTWLYPGDELSWPIPAHLADKLRLGADTLVLRGAAILPAGDDRADVALVARARVVGPKAEQVVEGEITLPTSGAFADACLRFDTPLPPKARLELTLAAPDPKAWFIVWTAGLGESEHVEGCGG